MTYPRLLADVGGTHARFAWQSDAAAPIADVAILDSAGYPTLQGAIEAYLSQQRKPTPRGCAISIAATVLDDRVHMTNHSWEFSIAGLKKALGIERFVVVNDFTALALALPKLPPRDLRKVGGGLAVGGGPCALIGPGTGLGVSGLLPARDPDFAVIAGEGGHATLAAADAAEDAVVAILRRRHGHASAERALSGQGLVDLYGAACELAGTAQADLEPAHVTGRALDGSDACCARAVELFCSFLGTAAGNLALTLGATGGVYIGGGIVPQLGDAFARSPFRARFESKGRFAPYLQKIPTSVIDAEGPPAFLGAAAALDRCEKP